MKKDRRKRTMRKQNVSLQCIFCHEHKEPWFSEVETLRRFVTERGKIISRARMGTCAVHQRRITQAIKHARHIALLPFTPHQGIIQ